MKFDGNVMFAHSNKGRHPSSPPAHRDGTVSCFHDNDVMRTLRVFPAHLSATDEVEMMYCGDTEILNW